MKVPAWVYVVGIIMIVFGGCGVVNKVASAGMQSSEFTETFNEAMEESMKQMPSDDKKALESLGLDDMTFDEETMELMSLFNNIGIFVGLFYLVAGLILLLKKKIAIKLVYAALVVSILFTIIQFFAMMSSESSLMKFGSFFLWFGVIVDLALLIVVAVVDKTQWKYLTGEFQAPEDPPHVYEN